MTKLLEHLAFPLFGSMLKLSRTRPTLKTPQHWTGERGFPTTLSVIAISDKTAGTPRIPAPQFNVRKVNLESVTSPGKGHTATHRRLTPRKSWYSFSIFILRSQVNYYAQSWCSQNGWVWTRDLWVISQTRKLTTAPLNWDGLIKNSSYSACYS